MKRKEITDYVTPPFKEAGSIDFKEVHDFALKLSQLTQNPEPGLISWRTHGDRIIDGLFAALGHPRITREEAKYLYCCATYSRSTFTDPAPWERALSRKEIEDLRKRLTTIFQEE